MNRLLEIEVTDGDIRNGIRRSLCQCPIALATIRAIKGFVPNAEVYVCKEYIAVETDELEIHYRVPKRASIFIRSFDNGYKVVPFIFIANRE